MIAVYFFFAKFVYLLKAVQPKGIDEVENHIIIYLYRVFRIVMEAHILYKRQGY